MTVRLETVGDAGQMDLVRSLFREYQTAIDIDLCFQNFEAELAALPGNYAPPRGRLTLAYVGRECAGCIALRPLPSDQSGADCEMKRLYVRPAYRRLHLGKLLAEHVLYEARLAGYRRVVLDTMSGMQSAQALYRNLGFIEIAPYYDNPLPDVTYMGLALT
jgi:putative acetyltransferase